MLKLLYPAEHGEMCDKNIKVCLVGSSGGHLNHLYMLKPFWEGDRKSVV